MPAHTIASAFGASRSIHSLVVIGWLVSGLLPKAAQYPSRLIDSFGIEPSTMSTKSSSSPRSATVHTSAVAAFAQPVQRQENASTELAVTPSARSADPAR